MDPIEKGLMDFMAELEAMEKLESVTANSHPTLDSSKRESGTPVKTLERTASSPVLTPTPSMTTTLPPTEFELARNYRFPDGEELFKTWAATSAASPTGAVLAYIKNVSDMHSASTPLPYPTIRAAFCALSVELNRRRVHPPRIRETRKLRPLPKGAKPSPADSLLSNDRQVIDLHWLYCARKGQPEPKWADIFAAEGFNFARASEFVAKLGTTANKARALRLTNLEEIELAVIQSRKTYDCWRTANLVRPDVECAVRSAVEHPRSRLRPGRGMEPFLPDAYVALRLAGGSPAAAARVMRIFDWPTPELSTQVDKDLMSQCKAWLNEPGRVRAL